ncbi:hypothetical protein [Dyella tabacisoli]|nr:hypothetical protein [Dyella tabacisoli]
MNKNQTLTVSRKVAAFVTRILSIVLLAAPAFVYARPNVLSAEVAAALHSGGSAVLYSLEPWADPEEKVARLQSFEILGQSPLNPSQRANAVAAIDSAIAGFDNIVAACFDPRHALRIQANGHTYDFLLCYSCHQLEIYRDSHLLESVGAAGSPAALNELMNSLHVPLSHSLEDSLASQREQQKKYDEGMRRWLPAMPTSIRRVWDTDPQFRMGMNPHGKALDDLKSALQAEVADRDERIRRLLTLNGSGVGPWSGYPAYEDIANALLLDFPTERIVTVAQSPGAEDALLEGAARYFAGWGFKRYHPQDVDLIPAHLKGLLLEHTLHSGDPKDDDRLDRATQAFGS